MNDEIEPLMFHDATEVAEELAELLPATNEHKLRTASEAVEVVIEKLERAPLVEALHAANEALPSMVKDLVRAYDEEDLTVNERIRIFETLSDFSIAPDRSREAMGMTKQQISEGVSYVFQQLNLNPSKLRELPHGGVDAALLRMAQEEEEGQNGNGQESQDRSRETQRENDRNPSGGDTPPEEGEEVG